MRKLINFIVAVFSIATLMFTTVYAEISIPKATSEFYVNDFSDILSESEEIQMIEKAKNLSDEHDGIQVVVTTIKSLEGNSIEDYSYEMYNQYGIGKDDMGLLILLATEDRQIRIEVGKSMEAYFNDSKAGRFIDNYAIPYLKENRFNEGLISLQEQCIKEIVLQIEKESNVTKTSEPADGNSVAIILIVLVCLVGFGIFVYNRVIAEGEKREEEERKRRIEEEGLRRQKEAIRLRKEEEERRRRREEENIVTIRSNSRYSSPTYPRVSATPHLSRPSSSFRNTDSDYSQPEKKKPVDNHQEEKERQRREEEERQARERQRKEEEERQARERRRREEEEQRERERQRREEEEQRERERRRREDDERRRMSSSSSSHSSSSGFGGRSGGGGATRSF